MFAALEMRQISTIFLLLAAGLKESVCSADKKQLPLVINTWAFIEANRVGWDVLHQSTTGNSALDAVVEGCTMCERLQCDGTVGYGGSPDETGETTLDAMIMDGSNMNIGAVAGLREIKDAIKVARHVLENTQHTLLVGDAATNFAVMMGFHRESLSTVTSKEIWKNWLNSNCQPNFWINVSPDASQSCGPYTPKMKIREDVKYFRERKSYDINRWNHDTIGMIVIDETGQIYAGTSTNGARHKIQGRVGDSPIPGAGAYADNEIGAAVATGDGDIMMRFLPSLLAVEFLRGGQTPEQSANLVMQRILRFYPDFSGGLIVTDKYGNYSAACVGMEKFPFSVVFGDATQTSRVEHVKCENSHRKAKIRDEFK